MRKILNISNRLLVLHPFLFTLFPILSLYASNVADVRFVQVMRPAGLGLLGVSGLLVALQLLLHDWHRAGLLASLASVLFFYFGIVYRMLGNQSHRWEELLLIAGLSLFFLGAWWTFKRAPRLDEHAPDSAPHPLSKVTLMLNRISALALSTCLWGFAVYGAQAVQAQAFLKETPMAEATSGIPHTGPAQEIQASVVSTVTPYRPPDIYYIILDGYGREDVLDDVYRLDNRPFLDYLEEKGFYIAGESHSNYPQTALSLSSSLNLNYLDKKLELDPEAESRLPLTTLIQENEVQRFLKDQGYRTISFTNGFPITEMQSVDEFHQPDEGLTNFEIALLSGSMAALEWNEEMQDDYRARVQWTVEELKAVVPTSGPKFVFVHLILPHPPFVFQSGGEARISLAGGDGSHFDGTQEEYIYGYREQLLYTNVLARQMINAILTNSEREPIILLQGDHGPGSHLDWESQDESCLWERFSILNAYYLPELKAFTPEEIGLYPGITPVNSFRLLLSRHFNAGLPPLEDRAYYATWHKPYDFQEVTGKVGEKCDLSQPPTE